MTLVGPEVRAEVQSGFCGRRALVVGDLMLDRYLVGDVGRISPEAPVPVVRLHEESVRVGGAGNVALNLAGLGLRVSVAGWAGDDESCRRLLDALADGGVTADAIEAMAGRPTTTKTRVLSRRQQMVRIDDEVTEPLADDARSGFDDRVLAQLDDDYDVLVLSDYAKGVLTDDLCRRLVTRAREREIPVLVDPKGMAFGKYAGATAVTPNEGELAAACRLDEVDLDAIVAAASSLRADLGLDVVAVTRGEHGILVVDATGSDQIPAHAREVFDVSGAGDTVIATLAAATAAGMPWRDAARIANVAAGVTVAKTGTAPVTREELLDALDAETGRMPAGPAEKLVADLDELAALGDRWRAGGHVIGFTNGCFDVLHAGHVTSVDWARHQCDRLVVALNSDDSVRALKGPGRPLVPARDRAIVVAALGAVDATIVFHDETPLRVIEVLRPDVLVKGSDYRDDEIVGAEEVRSWGGKVLRSPIVEGLSTTDLVARARDAG